MQEELSALKSILHTKDELINSLKEKLNSVQALKETSPEPLTCPEILMNTPQTEQPAMKRVSQLDWSRQSDWYLRHRGPERNTGSYPDRLEWEICKWETFIPKHDGQENLVPKHKKCFSGPVW